MAANNTSRIAKNTIFLYLRSLVVMLIALYTSRVVLRVLGVEDYGIYNVVGGVIGLLATLRSTMSATYQRYFNVEMGKKNPKGVTNMFQLSLASQVILASIILFLGETVGLWFVSNKLVIPDNRLTAALWVYQASIISFILSIFSAPFGALITAYERMDVFAVISIIDSVLQLVIVFLIQVLPGDQLIVYAYLHVIVALFNFSFNLIYCKKNIKETVIGFKWNRELKSMFVFSGWSIFAELGNMAKTQGISIILNMFFGPVVNAARGVASQVLKAVNQFIKSFQTSFRPQLTKSYASGDYEYMRKLYYSSTKMSYYLIFTLSLPIILEIPFILRLWLGDNVPEYTAVFTRLVLLTAFVGTYSNPTSGIIYASGNIKLFSIIVGIGNVLILPVAWVVLEMGYGPASAMVVSLIMSILIQICRITIAAKVAPIKILEYMKKVVFPTVVFSIFSAIGPLCMIKTISSSFVRLLFVCIVSVLSCFLCAWLFGLNKYEKQFVLSKIKKTSKK